MQLSPTKERIQIIDILRGLTLLGIIMVHFTEQYYAGMPPLKATHLNSTFLPDQIVRGFISFFIAGKFFMLFSFLFGLSFFLQSNGNENKSSFYIRFFWRLLVLFGIGWIHSLHYRGDILTIYAMLGIVLLALHTLPDRVVLLLAILLIADVPSLVSRGVEAYSAAISAAPSGVGENPFGGSDAENAAYFNTLKGSSYLAILKANVPEFLVKMKFQVLSGRLYVTMGLFLLGLYVGRKKVFENLKDNLVVIKRLRNKSLWGILMLILFALAFFGGAEALKMKLSMPMQFLVGGEVMALFNAFLALFYVCVLILLYQKEHWKKRLSTFYCVGRMGLTTYLMQTFFGFFIFFGVGFNLLDKMGAGVCFILALCLFVIQLIIADWWLGYFYYGPVEWLWRSLTYLKLQPFRRK